MKVVELYLIREEEVVGYCTVPDENYDSLVKALEGVREESNTFDWDNYDESAQLEDKNLEKALKTNNAQMVKATRIKI